MPTEPYEPELGQLCFGNPSSEYQMPRFADALFMALWEEIGRVYWNHNRERFSDYGTDDPKIQGITVRPYWWGDGDAPEREQANFAYAEVEIRWYKYPGRGMSCNVDWTPNQWSEWFSRCLKVIQDSDVDLG